jgi:hypothetical protein
MFSQIRKRITYVNVLVTLALVFAMTGGALAAKKYLITSTKQISPSVLKSLQGKAGAAGAPGPQGPAGPGGAKGENGANGSNGAPGTNGSNGAPGAKGEPGSTGPAGKTGPTGPKGEKGENGGAGATGPTGPKGGTGPTGPEGVCSKANCTLPSGTTETGTWSAVLFGIPGAGAEPAFAISFPIPLESAGAGKAFYFNEEETEEEHFGTSGCKGTLDTPTAPSGTLCVYTYEEGNENAKFAEILGPKRPFPLMGFGKTGALLVFKSSAAGKVKASGTWAVTAP